MSLKLCNTENMRTFVTALRSGEYVQGHKKLELVPDNGPVRNCCLGVACRVALANGVELKTDTAYSLSVGSQFIHFGTESNYLPDSVAQWLGVDEEPNPLNPNLMTEDHEWFAASDLNDSMGFTFAQIADAFERTYLID